MKNVVVQSKGTVAVATATLAANGSDYVMKFTFYRRTEGGWVPVRVQHYPGDEDMCYGSIDLSTHVAPSEKDIPKVVDDILLAYEQPDSKTRWTAW